MELGIEYAKKNNADLLLATDPDCDRVGIAVKNTQGEYVLLSGNETGMLLLDYICSRRTQMKTMPEDPVTVKTIVSIDMTNNIFLKFPHLSWRGMVHVLSLAKDVEKVKKLRRGGCRELFIGIESGSESVRRKINKLGTIRGLNSLFAGMRSITKCNTR